MTPYLTVRNAEAAISFYQQAFGAAEKLRLVVPDGKAIVHAELQIGDALLYLSEEFPEMCNKSPQTLNGSPVTLHLQVDNADAWFDRAVHAGATVIMPLENMFWGDRYGRLSDPFGHQWAIASHVEDVSPEEMNQRMLVAMSS
jgi:uncharacterized glyoxalase superfamily protein PhnB